MFEGFLENIKESLALKVGQKANNYIFFRHYNSMGNDNRYIELIKSMKISAELIYHRYDASDMLGSYEPFLEIIRTTYYENFDISIEEFLDRCEIYTLHRSIMKSFLEMGECKRAEELLLDEVEYEKKMMVSSVTKMLIYVSKMQPIYIVLDDLQEAGESTFELISEIMDSSENENIGILVIYNELYRVYAYGKDKFDLLCQKAENLGVILEDDSLSQYVNPDLIKDFSFNIDKIDEYIIKLNNMMNFMDFEQAKYYFELIYKLISIENLMLPDESKMKIFLYYAMTCVYSGDMSKALLLCDNMHELGILKNSYKALFDYNYTMATVNMYNGKLELSSQYAERCYQIAIDKDNEFLCFKSKLLEVMIKMSGWHNIFFCAEDVHIDDDVIVAAKKYGFINHLAHIYVYAFDNDPNYFKDEESVKENLIHYNKGIYYAEKIGNEHFLIKAYRNNIMIASTNGYFKTANYYYYKYYEVVKDTNPFDEANIYNGIGYNSCAMEDYVKANDLYNKAIRIFMDLNMMDYVGETLYNMGINCIMADDYDRAYQYLNTCLKVVKGLKLNSLRVCNISKLFGLLSLCCFHLNKKNSCMLYLSSCKQFLSHLIDNNDKKTSIIHDYTLCDDDLFMYYFVTGLVYTKEENYNEALNYFNTASRYVKNAGNQFFTYAQYSVEKSKLHRMMNQDVLANQELEKCLEFFVKTEAFQKAEKIRAELNEGKVETISYSLTLDTVTLDEIYSALKQGALVKENAEYKKQMSFLATWQRIIDVSGKTRETLIDVAIQAFSNNFNIDRVMFIEYKEDEPNVLYDNTNLDVETKKHLKLKEYFKKKRLGFVVSKIDSNYADYTDIISLFESENVCSMVGIPYYENENLKAILVAYIVMKDNWHSPINKYMLDEGDFKNYEFIFRQLISAVDALDANEKVKIMNIQLEKAAVTDNLTGLMNREGFYKTIEDMLKKIRRGEVHKGISLMYIDLDNFKYYNDTFGHDVGDIILKEMSKVFLEVCKNIGFVTRYGGDEFIIILNTGNKEKVESVLWSIYKAVEKANGFEKEICEVLGKTVEIDDNHRITCSIGVTISDNIETNEMMNEMIKKSDDILYGIKNSRKGTYKIV